MTRRVELAAEDVVVACEEAQGRECERVGHQKIGFDVRSLAPPDPQTGYRDPVTGVRRIEVKGRKRGQPVRLTTNEWYKVQQLGDTYWLYVVWDPLDDPDATPLMIRNPAKHLDYANPSLPPHLTISHCIIQLRWSRSASGTTLVCPRIV